MGRYACIHNGKVEGIKEGGIDELVQHARSMFLWKHGEIHL